MCKGKGVLIIVMTWLILSWMFLCSQFLCYNQSIINNPFAYTVAINRKFPTAPILPNVTIVSKEVELHDKIVLDNKPSDDDVVWLIKYYSKKIWVDEELALNIAWCESWYKNKKNPNSSAGWIYQQLGRFRPKRAKKYWYEWYDRFNIEANIVVSLKMIKNEWVFHRNPSRYCWDK